MKRYRIGKKESSGWCYVVAVHWFAGNMTSEPSRIDYHYKKDMATEYPRTVAERYLSVLPKGFRLIPA